MKKVIITKKDGKKGVLTLAQDGKWDVEIDGRPMPQNYHYTTDQIERIIASARANGENVELS